MHPVARKLLQLLDGLSFDFRPLSHSGTRAYGTGPTLDLGLQLTPLCLSSLSSANTCQYTIYTDPGRATAGVVFRLN